MRFFRTTGLVAAAALAAATAFAAPVGEETVLRAAAGFLARSSAAKRMLEGRVAGAAERRGGVWIVRLEPSGYIELSGSTRCAPVLSFSPCDFEEPAPGSPLDAKLGADGEWCEARESDGSLEDDAGWAALAAAAAGTRRLLAAPSAGESDPYLAPFLGARWHQTAPYSDLTPLSGPCGCTATAGGQELRYWRWPYRMEGTRTTTHALRNKYDELSQHVLRPNGLVPFDWDKILGSYPSPASAPQAADKASAYNAAYLVHWMQSCVQMVFKPGGAGGLKKLNETAGECWYEQGRVASLHEDGYAGLWSAVTNDLASGSPIQVNSPQHQMVVEGYAVDDAGTANEVDWICINYGWGGESTFFNFRTAVEDTCPGGQLVHFQVGYRPQKIVQFEPVPKVCGSSLALAWHIAPCYTNKISGFLLTTEKDGEFAGAAMVPVADGLPERYVHEIEGLAAGSGYRFTVLPAMSDGSEARANSVTTTSGSPRPAPEMLGVSSVACGIELVQQGFYVECGRGMVNEIAVECSPSTTSLKAYSSHPTVLPDGKVGVSKDGNVFTLAVDASDMAADWDGDMLILTLVAANEDGTEAYKNLMLRFNSMRQVLDGTFDAVAGGDADSPVWFCGDTTIDAKGQAVVFGPDAFQGTGAVTLVDSVGGGSFAFDGLGRFKGTLRLTESATVALPSSMQDFCGTLAFVKPNNINFHHTLSTDLPATAKVFLPAGTYLYLDNVTVDAALSGYGYININSGTSSIGNLSGFDGSIELGTFDDEGELTLRAGQEKSVSVWNGTLYLTLSRAQVAYGYSTTAIDNVDYGSSVVFQDEEGNVLRSWLTYMNVYSIEASANTWRPASGGTGSFSDAARWTKGLPSAGDYVIFSGNNAAATMTLDLSSDFNLGYVFVTNVPSASKFTISGSCAGTLSVDTLENAVPTKLSTLKIQPTTVVPRDKLFINPGFTIACDIDQSLAQNLRDDSDTFCALVEDEGMGPYCVWRGTVVFSDYTAKDLDLDFEWGHSGSSVRLNGVTGYFKTNKGFAGTTELRDSGTTPALHWNDGSSGSTVTFAALAGDGTFKTSGSGGASEKALLKDVSAFTGSFDLAAKTVAIAPSVPSENLGGNGRLHICQAVTNTAGKTWRANGGVYLGESGSLVVNGVVETPGGGVSAYGAGTSLTVEDGAILKVSAATGGGFATALRFKAGTYMAARSLCETNRAEFCAAAGRHTTIDACGNELILGPGFLSGSGDICLTSSGAGGFVKIEGISSSYSGTIYCDVSCRVGIGDMTGATNCTVSISDVVLSRDSSDVGNIDVGLGATLSVVLSDREAKNGFRAGTATLSGGTIEFVDRHGRVLASSTESTTYVPPEDYAPAVVPGTVSQDDGMAQENVAFDVAGEWAVVDDKPVYLRLSSPTNTFTVAFDADIPEGFGTLLSWDSVKDSTRLDSRVVCTNDPSKSVIWRKADGTLSTVGYSRSGVVPSGEHRIVLEWKHDTGAVITVDGSPFYSSGNLKFTGYGTTLLALGGSALGGPDDVLKGLKVRNLVFLGGRRSVDEESLPAEVKTLADRQRTLYLAYVRDRGGRTVLLNGAATSAATSARLIDYFALDSVYEDVEFSISGIDPSGRTVTPRLAPPLRNGRLVLVGSEDLRNWFDVSESDGGGAVGLGGAGSFFRFEIRDR